MRKSPAALVLAVVTATGCDPVEPLTRPGASISGVVCDSLTGRPRRNVEVSCRVGDERIDVVSDGAGNFLCPRVPTTEREALVRVDEGGERKARRYTVEVFPGEQSVMVDTACREGPGQPGVGDVDGRVCNRHTGELMVQADVSIIVQADGDAQVLSQQSSGEPDPGRFYFADVPVGDWPLVIDAAGFHRTLAITVVEGQITEVDLGVCEDDDLIETGPVGGARGHVCMFDGDDLGGATISTTLPDGSTRSTTSDVNGDWQMGDLPPGEYTFRIEAGSYSAERTVTVEADTVVELPEDDCELDQDGVKIAVVEGSWDDVYSVLVNVGVDPSIIDNYTSYDSVTSLFGSAATLATYDAVFINCGAEEYEWQTDPVLQQNLAAYVLAGGNVYASDLAYDFVERIFPTFVDYFGDDSTYDAAEVGVAGDVPGTIHDAFLESAIGTSNITLHYPYGTWAIVTGTTSGVQVLIRGRASYDDWLSGGAGGTIENNPHTLMYRPGGATSGKVVFSSFHQEPGINVQQERILQLLMFQL